MSFQQISEALLFLDNDFGRLRSTAKEYYSFLSQIADFSDDSQDSSDSNETILENGKAISPKDAARCVMDFARTIKFLRGIYAAIIVAKKRFPNEKIEILYAGCGPFATLAVPLCTKFSPDEIAFTLIDMHQHSLDSARKVFQKLEMQDFVNEYIKTDAVEYKNENGKKFHIILAEVMQKALDKEPQVALTLHLANQLLENGIFIPQKILVEACLIDVSKEFALGEDAVLERKRIGLGSIFELSMENSSKEKLLSPQIIEIPKGDFESMSLALLTKVLVFDEFILNEYDSGITTPKILHDFPKIKNNQQIEFQYVLSKNPQFEYRLL